MRQFGKIIASLILLYFVVRAAAEPFVISPSDPASYRNDWGGPSYLGVMAVHVLPGVVALVLLWLLWRKHPAE